jgi:phage terminase small subunit
MVLNAKQERFAQSVAEGMNASSAYSAAGYSASKNGAIRANASRLLTNANVKSRIAALQRQAAARTLVTIEGITAELNASFAVAARQQNPSAMTAASMAKAKLHGLVVERAEVEQTVRRKPTRDPAAPGRMTRKNGKRNTHPSRCNETVCRNRDRLSSAAGTTAGIHRLPG